MKLVRKIYFKITDKNKVYYLLEKAYTSKNDGYIQTYLIEEETFLKALENAEMTQEIELDNARPNIQYEIRNIA